MSSQPTYLLLTRENLSQIITTLLDEIRSSSGSYTLPTATTSVLGGVKIDGSTIKVNQNGQIYVDLPSLDGVSY
jgi:hypothetical protein